MHTGADRQFGRIRQLEKSDISVSGCFLIGIHGVRNGKCQVIAQHSISPDDMGCWVVPAQHGKEIDDGLFKAQDIRLAISSIWLPMQSEGLSCDGVCPFRLVEGAGIVRSQIDNDGVRYPTLKIVRFSCAQFFVHFAGYQSADFFITGRKSVPRVVIPAAQNPPAALRDKAVFRIQGIGDHSRIIMTGAHIHGKPVHILFGAVGSLAGSDAVADKFQFKRSVFYRKKSPVGTKSLYQQTAGIVLRHGLKLPEESDIFSGIGTHAPEKAQRIRTGH